ncbi:hypothetical protein [Kutzneria kofuensis]
MRSKILARVGLLALGGEVDHVSADAVDVGGGGFAEFGHAAFV